MKDGFAKAFWPLVPLIVVASLVGVGYAVATSSDKSELEQQLEMLQQKNTQSNQGNPAAAAAPASPEENTSRPMPTGNEITAIGDSVMLAASEALQQRYPGIYVDADVPATTQQLSRSFSSSRILASCAPRFSLASVPMARHSLTRFRKSLTSSAQTTPS